MLQSWNKIHIFSCFYFFNKFYFLTKIIFFYNFINSLKLFFNQSFKQLIIFNKTKSFFKRQKHWSLNFRYYKFYKIIKFRYFTYFWFIHKNKSRNTYSLKFSVPSKLFLVPHSNLSMHKKICYLIGLKLFPFRLDFRWKKKWISSRAQFFIKYNKRNRKRQKLFFLKDFLSTIDPFNKVNVSRPTKTMFFKKQIRELSINYDEKFLYYNSIFFFLKFKISYSQFKYVARTIKAKFPTHLTPFKFKTPYFFLHISKDVIKNAAFPLQFIITKFRRHKKFFKSFRRLHYKKKTSFKYHTRYVSFFKKQAKFFRYRLFKSINYKSKLFFQLSKITHTKSILTQNFIVNDFFHYKNNFFRARKKLFYKWNFRSLWLKKFKLIYRLRRNFKKIYRFKKFIRYFLLNNKLNRLSIFNFTAFLIIQHRFKNNLAPFNNSLISNSTCVHVHKNFFFRNSILSSLIKYKINNFLSNREYNFFNNKKLFFKSEYSIDFKTPLIGFLFLSNTLPLKYFSESTPYTHKIRKIMYSFSKRNDLPKHILRKNFFFKLANVITRFQSLNVTISSNFKLPGVKALWTKYPDEGFPSLFNFTTNLLTIAHPVIGVKFPILNLFKHRLINKTWYKFDNIFTVRFKPGYMTQWRIARTALKLRLHGKFKYQHQLTKYLVIYKKLSKVRSFALTELKLVNVIVRSRLFLDPLTATSIIENKNVFVNGVNCFNPSFTLFANDFVQLIISFKYYIVFKWLLSLSLKIRMKIKRLSKAIKKKTKLRKPEKTYNKNVPLGISHHLTLFLDIVKYVEVDFFTLSLFILYDPFLWHDTNQYNHTIQKIHIYNMYNWKYIT